MSNAASPEWPRRLSTAVFVRKRRDQQATLPFVGRVPGDCSGRLSSIAEAAAASTDCHLSAGRPTEQRDSGRVTDPGGRHHIGERAPGPN